MKINFKYNKERDILCLMNSGKSSFNSKQATKVYEELVEEYGENINENNISKFIDNYIKDNSIKIEKCINDYQEDWNSIENKYNRKAEEIFGISLIKDIDVYITINTRCPYSVEENWFFVSVCSNTLRKTVMHELWHFYTWYKFGNEWEQKLGKQKYNDIKESLTVLLNVEFKDLLNNIQDNGYPQHKELRDNILNIWNKEKDINSLWEELVTL